MQEFKPKIVAFYCSNCASSAAEISNKLGLFLPENIKLINVPCTGRIEILHLLKAFENGADMVYVVGCQEDSCQYINGILKLKKRVAHVKNMLEQMGIEPQRLEVFSLYAGKGQDFVNIANEMLNRAKQLGPIY
ncbi:MAG: F420-nonreducing hydrogenase [Deltaproteobacteria bacterium]|nr:MAG: F420-nonreducing hydrogenase [Deltaproteobacteria bacterium]